MPECPYCGRWFKTKRGLNQHIRRSHEDDFGFLNPLTFDPLGAAERRAERARKRRRRRDFLDMLGFP